MKITPTLNEHGELVAVHIEDINDGDDRHSIIDKLRQLLMEECDE